MLTAGMPAVLWIRPRRSLAGAEEGERDAAGDVGCVVGGGGGAEKGLMNAGGMLQECRIGREKGGGDLFFILFYLFFSRGSPLNQRRCGPMGNQRIIIPLLLTFPPLQNTHSRLPTHTHTPCTHSSQAFPALCPVSAGEQRPPPKFCRCFFVFFCFYTFSQPEPVASSRRCTQRSESNSQLRFWAWNLLLFLIPPVKSRPQFDPLRWPIRLGRDITPGP